MRLPVRRLRLTLVFTLCMAVLLTVTGTFVYLRLGAELLRSTDAALRSQADAVAAGLGQQGAAFNPPATAGGLGSFTQVVGAGGQVLESSPGLGGRPGRAAVRADRPAGDDLFRRSGPWNQGNRSRRGAPSGWLAAGVGAAQARRRRTGTRSSRRCWSSC